MYVIQLGDKFLVVNPGSKMLYLSRNVKLHYIGSAETELISCSVDIKIMLIVQAV